MFLKKAEQQVSSFIFNDEKKAHAYCYVFCWESCSEWLNLTEPLKTQHTTTYLVLFFSMILNKLMIKMFGVYVFKKNFYILDELITNVFYNNFVKVFFQNCFIRQLVLNIITFSTVLRENSPAQNLNAILYNTTAASLLKSLELYTKKTFVSCMKRANKLIHLINYFLFR